MPFVDYLKRFFGIRDSDSQSNTSPQQSITPFDRYSLDLDVREYNEPYTTPHIPFDNDQFFEQQFSQLENFVRNIGPFLFSFGFGSPDSPIDGPPHEPMPPMGPPHPDSGGFPPFFGIPRIFEFGGRNKGIFGPTMEEETLSPRDEVLKPSYRSTNHNDIRIMKDEDYDDLVREKGPGVIVDMLRKSEEEDRFNERQIVPFDERQMMPPVNRAPMGSMSRGHFSSTKFSFVNGESVQEQLTRLPDGTYEKRVTRTNGKGETNTVVSHHTQEEIAPTLQGGFGIPIFRGFGPSFW